MASDVERRWAIPLAATDIGEAEREAVRRVLQSGWLTAGPETERFEREFAERVGARHALAVANCTAALHLAHVALGVGPGDEVLCPALTFVATANAARYAGADVVFCDVNGRDDLTVAPGDIERKINGRTRAISVLHYGGFAARMEAILEIAQRYDLPVIEDCAHAPLARANDRSVGTLGAVGCFSFFGNKNMTTGEGGMLTTDDDELAGSLRLLRSHGMTSASYDRFRGHAHGYDVPLLGYNYRFDDIRSAIGRVQLARLAGFNAARRRVYRWYLEELDSVAGLRVPFADRDLEHAAPHIMSVVVERDVDALRGRLAAAAIQSSRHYAPVSSFSIYREAAADTPIVDGLELLTLPFGANLSREQVARIAAVLRGDAQ